MRTEIDLDTRIKQSESLQAADMGNGEAILMSVRHGVYYRMNHVARRIFEWAATPVALREVRDRLLAEYEVDPDTCERDLDEYVRQLREQGLVEILDDPSAA